MTADIKNHVSTSEACPEYERGQALERNDDVPYPKTPTRPWQQVAADLLEKTYFVTSDYHSDFFEFNHLRSPSSVCVIRKFKIP